MNQTLLGIIQRSPIYSYIDHAATFLFKYLLSFLLLVFVHPPTTPSPYAFAAASKKKFAPTNVKPYFFPNSTPDHFRRCSNSAPYSGDPFGTSNPSLGSRKRRNTMRSRQLALSRRLNYIRVLGRGHGNEGGCEIPHTITVHARARSWARRTVWRNRLL